MSEWNKDTSETTFSHGSGAERPGHHLPSPDSRAPPPDGETRSETGEGPQPAAGIWVAQVAMAPAGTPPSPFSPPPPTSTSTPPRLGSGNWSRALPGNHTSAPQSNSLRSRGIATGHVVAVVPPPHPPRRPPTGRGHSRPLCARVAGHVPRTSGARPSPRVSARLWQPVTW